MSQSSPRTIVHVESNRVTRNFIGVSSPVDKRIGSSIALSITAFEDPSSNQSRIGVIGYARRLFSCRKVESMKDQLEPQSRSAWVSEFSSGGVEMDRKNEGFEREEALSLTSNGAQSSPTQPSSCAESCGLLSLFSSRRSLRRCLRRFY